MNRAEDALRISVLFVPGWASGQRVSRILPRILRCGDTVARVLE